MLVTACILPLLFFSPALLFRNSAAEMAATEAQIRERARLLGEDIDRELARMQAVGEVLALSETLSNGDLEGFYCYAAEVRDLLGRTRSIWHGRRGRMLRSWMSIFLASPLFRSPGSWTLWACRFSSAQGTIR